MMNIFKTEHKRSFKNIKKLNFDNGEMIRKSVKQDILFNCPEYLSSFNELTFLPKHFRNNVIGKIIGNTVYYDPSIALKNPNKLKHVIEHELAHRIERDKNGYLKGDCGGHNEDFYQILSRITGEDSKQYYDERGRLKGITFDMKRGK